MANLRKKNELAALLKRLEGADTSEHSVIDGLIKELEDLKNSQEQPDLSPYFSEVKSLEGKYVSVEFAIISLKNLITDVSTALEMNNSVTDSKIEELTSLILDSLKSLDLELTKIKKDNVYLRGLGGGSKPPTYYLNSSVMSTRYADLNFKAGAGTSLAAVNNNTTKQVDFTLTSTATGGLTLLLPTGTVNGINNVFVFSSSPSVIIVDQGRSMQKTSSDGTINWTGTTTATLSIAPNFDIFGLG